MLKYKGGGYIPGVPARDLTDEEEKKFTEKYGRAALLKLYERVRKSKKIEPETEQAEE